MFAGLHVTKESASGRPMKATYQTILSKISTFITESLFFFRILKRQCTLLSFVSCIENNL